MLMIKLSEIKEGAVIGILIHNDKKRMRMGARIKKHVKDNVALITLDYGAGKKLIFDNVEISMEYTPLGDVPLIWNNCKILNYQSEYVLVATTDATRNNRRNAFRVGVSKLARVMSSNGPSQVMVRDMSTSGFSITDRTGNLPLKMGDEMTIYLDDMGHELNLRGKLVRIDKKEDCTIYGFVICNMCRDLSSYVSYKQRRVRDSRREMEKKRRGAI